MNSNTYTLVDHVRVCRTLLDTVGLDLKRNRYFALGARETHALIAAGVLPIRHSVLLEPPTGDPREVIRGLVAAGILEQCERAPSSSRLEELPAPIASAGYEHQATRRVGPKALRDVVCAYHWALKALAVRTLYDTYRELRTAQRPSTCDLEPLIIATNVFRTVRPYAFSARGRCLIHALTLHRFLHLQGLSARWVMAVRTRAWAAHSWVQRGEFVFDARPEDVCEYTPLLIA
jgi:hypothetical protein